MSHNPIRVREASMAALKLVATYERCSTTEAARRLITQAHKRRRRRHHERHAPPLDMTCRDITTTDVYAEMLRDISRWERRGGLVDVMDVLIAEALARRRLAVPTEAQLRQMEQNGDNGAKPASPPRPGGFRTPGKSLLGAPLVWRKSADDKASTEPDSRTRRAGR